MIADLKPYADYRDSGLPWLGQVPAHWQIVRSKRLFTPNKELARTDDVQLSATQAYGVIAQSTYEERTGYRVVKISMHLDKRRHVEVGDFVISMRSFQGGLEHAWTAGAIRSSYVVLRPDSGVDPSYFRYLFKSKPYIRALQATANFIRDGQDLNFNNFCDVHLPLVPLSEQAAIGQFLDWATSRLDRAIRAKRRLIALLKEQRQAIIDRAVTGGIDSSVPLKPSGVKWLGDTPQHWATARSKRLFTPRTELALPGDVQLSATQAYGVIPQEEYEAKVGRRVTKIFMHLEKRRHVVRDDFVISMRSFEGGLERAWASGAIRSSYVVLKSAAPLNVDFFAYLFKSRAYIRALQSTAEFIREGQDMNFANFCRVDLPIVPLEEQAAISSFITRSTANLGESVARFTGEVDLLREYGARLISDAVTGQLDLRKAATGLPAVDEHGETESSPQETGEDEESDEKAEA